MRLFLCDAGIPVPLAGHKITGGIEAMVDDGAGAGIFYDGRLMAFFIPVVAHVVKLIAGKRKPQADFQSAFFQQGGAYLYGNDVLLLVTIGEHIDRYAFEREMAFDFAGPHIQLLVQVVQVGKGSGRAIFFDELKTDIAQLQAMYVFAEIIAGTLVSFRGTPLHRIGYFTAIEVIITQAFFKAVTAVVGKTVPAPF